MSVGSGQVAAALHEEHQHAFDEVSSGPLASLEEGVEGAIEIIVSEEGAAGTIFTDDEGSGSVSGVDKEVERHTMDPLFQERLSTVKRGMYEQHQLESNLNQRGWSDGCKQELVELFNGWRSRKPDLPQSEHLIPLSPRPMRIDKRIETLAKLIAEARNTFKLCHGEDAAYLMESIGHEVQALDEHSKFFLEDEFSGEAFSLFFGGTSEPSGTEHQDALKELALLESQLPQGFVHRLIDIKRIRLVIEETLLKRP